MEQNLKIYTGQAAKVLNFLKGGCTPIQAAQAVGVTIGYVSQLCKEEDFQAQIAQKLQADFEKAIETDKNLDEIEHTLSDKLKKLVPFMVGLDDILKTMKVVQGQKRKVAPSINPGQDSGGSGAKIVTLVLPKVLVQNFITNPNSEIVAVDGKEMITLNSQSLDSLAKRVLDEEVIENTNMVIPKLEYSQPKAQNVKSNEDKWGNL
jgi:hypothetical protein